MRLIDLIEGEQDLTFFRGTTPGDTRRINEPFSEARGLMFVARTPEAASQYGSEVAEIRIRPHARVLKEEDPAFWRILGRRRPPNGFIGSAGRYGETIIDLVNLAIRKAKEHHYDVLSFKSDSDIGTIILNSDVIVR